MSSAEPAKSSFEIVGSVALLTLDDGKANAIGYETLAAIDKALETASQDASALVIAGRPGRFSAGFDLGVIAQGPAAARDLVAVGARTAMRMFGAPIPIVAACTGHSLAFGAIMLLASDLRLGADVKAKIGLNEVSLGMPLPIFGVELARQRLSPKHLTAATNLATLYSPAGAAEAGYLDEVLSADDLLSAAVSRAESLGAYLQPAGFALTRRNLRQPVIDHVLETLDDDLAEFGVLS